MIQSVISVMDDLGELARDFNCIENVKNITSETPRYIYQKRFASEYSNFTASSRVYNQMIYPDP
jgi:hypothetical protein